MESVLELRGFGFGKKQIIAISTNICAKCQAAFWHTHAVENVMVINVIYLSTNTLSSYKTYFEGTGTCRKDRGTAFSPKKTALGC